jgi:ribonuclease BN (tRNA processing enzyme)
MQLTIIGAGPAYTSRAGAAASSYLVEACAGAAGAEREALLLDLGQGAFSNLAATMEPSALTAVLISHLHPDHFIDLVALRHYLKWDFTPDRHVRVLAPAGLEDRLDALHGQPGFASATLDIERIGPGTARLGGFEVEAFTVAHTDESFAFRVSRAAGSGSGGSNAPGLVYSGDLADARDLAPLVRPGDTLLCEASFGAGPVPLGAKHITSADAARVAAEKRAGRLLLTHVLAGYSRPAAFAAARAHFDGPLQFVTEGDRFEI